MKRIYCLILTVLLGACLLMPVTCFAEEQPPAVPAATEAAPSEEGQPATEAAPQPETTQVEKPMLTDIAFSGAQLDSAFQKDVFEYQLTVSDHSTPIRPSSYKATDYNAMVQVNYLTNTSGDAIGLIVRVFNQAGANEYKFLFDSIQEIQKTPDASLLGLNFDFGELFPAFDANVFRYTLYLPSDLEVLNINAVASDENAKINTPSQITLNPDQPSPIAIKVVSSDGTNTATYKLNIKRVDKTISQIKAEMEDPNFISFVEIPFYRTAPFYIISGVSIFLAALALVLFFTLRRKKALSNGLSETDAAAEAVLPQPEPPEKSAETVVPAPEQAVKEPAPEQTAATLPKQTKKSKKSKKKSQPEAEKTEEPVSSEKAEQTTQSTVSPQEQATPLKAHKDKDPAPPAPEEPATAPEKEEKSDATPAEEKAAPAPPAEEQVVAPVPQPLQETPAIDVLPSKKRRSLFRKKEKSPLLPLDDAPSEAIQPATEPESEPKPAAAPPDVSPAVGEKEPEATVPDTVPKASPQEDPDNKNAEKPQDPAINEETFDVNGLDLDKYNKYK